MTSAAPSSSAVSPFDSLPDELLLKIVKFAAAPPWPFHFEWIRERWMAEHGEKYDHDFLANGLCKVSLRFEKISSDESLWKGVVWIGPRSKLGTIEWVIRECLNGGTTVFNMPGNLTGCAYNYMNLSHVCDGWLRFVDPLQRFPNLKVSLSTSWDLGIGGIGGSHEVDEFYLEELRRRLLTPPPAGRYQDEGNDGWERSYWSDLWGWSRNCCRRHEYGYGLWSASREDCSSDVSSLVEVEDPF